LLETKPDFVIIRVRERILYQPRARSYAIAFFSAGWGDLGYLSRKDSKESTKLAGSLQK